MSKCATDAPLKSDGVHWDTVKDTCQQNIFSDSSIDTYFDPAPFSLDSTFKCNIGSHYQASILHFLEDKIKITTL